MDAYSQRLVDALTKVVEPWLRRSFDEIASTQGLQGAVDPIRRDEIVSESARATLIRLRELFETDVLSQRSNPLQILRGAVGPLTTELVRMGARPVDRDEFQRRSFPDDVFGLCPAAWVDIEPTLNEVGLEWGAWKAAAVMHRRRDVLGDRDG